MNEPWIALWGLLGMIAALAFGLLGLSGSVWLMIWPVERRARAEKGRFRFRLIDLGCLLVYWQVILAALVAIGREDIERVAGLLVIFGVVGCVISALTWSVCVGVLSRAGIESSARRATFILVSIPGAIAAAGAFVISGMAAAMNVYYLIADPTAAVPVHIPVVIFLVSIAAIFLLRLVSLWIAMDARTS